MGSDVAIAVVITKLSLAKTLSIEPAIIHAYSQGMSKEHSLMTDYHGDNPMQSSSYVTSENLWEQSDFKPADVDVAQFYDAFSPMIPLSLEAYTFCTQDSKISMIIMIC